jgi:hypothetical protein
MNFIVAIIFLFISLAMLVAFIVSETLDKKNVPGVSCNTNQDCPVDSICKMGVCMEIICSTDTDCPDSGICFDNYCYSNSCNIGNDCPDEMACVTGGVCTTVGATCTTNSDCQNLACVNGVCLQCQNSTDCPLGQSCFSNVCRYPNNSGETPTGETYYNSDAQVMGNLAAPPGYLCESAFCGVTASVCSSDISCNGSCPYCVDSVCRCTKGEIYESCVNNIDCLSNFCKDSSLGKICYPSGGECAFNYGTTGVEGTGVCTIDKPYCSNGICSITSDSSICGGNVPDGMCSNPLLLGLTGITGVNPDPMGAFCVQGICSTVPGLNNQICLSDSDCGFLGTQNGKTIFVCSNGRCTPGAPS